MLKKGITVEESDVKFTTKQRDRFSASRRKSMDLSRIIRNVFLAFPPTDNKIVVDAIRFESVLSDR